MDEDCAQVQSFVSPLDHSLALYSNDLGHLVELAWARPQYLVGLAQMMLHVVEDVVAGKECNRKML